MAIESNGYVLNSLSVNEECRWFAEIDFLSSKSTQCRGRQPDTSRLLLKL